VSESRSLAILICQQQIVKQRIPRAPRRLNQMTTIAIIGTGNVGGALGTAAAKAGYDVVYAARDAARTRAVAEANGGTAVASAREAVSAADIVVLAIPYAAIPGVAGEIAPVVAGKVVIDPTNPLKADHSGLATEGGPSGAEGVAVALPGARVVKGFNTVFAGNTADPTALGTRLDHLFATDDDVAKEAIGGLSSAIGFRPIHVGPLSAARELEAMAWLNIRLQMLNGGAWNTAYALLAPPPAALTAG
jgi:8-hydroxy-5-deazaflavin:NADPH oxidoreductase